MALLVGLQVSKPDGQFLLNDHSAYLKPFQYYLHFFSPRLACAHWTGSLVIFQTDGVYFLLRTLAQALPQAWSLFLAIFQFINVFPVLQGLLTPRPSLTASCFGDYLLSGTTGSPGCTSHVALLRTPICGYTFFCETCVLHILMQVYTHIAMRCFFFCLPRP